MPELSWPAYYGLRTSSKKKFVGCFIAFVILILFPSTSDVGERMGYKNHTLKHFVLMMYSWRIYLGILLAIATMVFALLAFTPEIWGFELMTKVENCRDFLVLFGLFVVTIFFLIVVIFEPTLAYLDWCANMCYTATRSLVGFLISAWILALLFSRNSIAKIHLYVEKFIRMVRLSENALDPFVYPIEIDLAYFKKEL